MKRRLLALLAVIALFAPAAASAHPLGNFTVNRYSGVELSGDRVYVAYVLDMAEIPTFQERQEIEKLGEAAYARRLVGEIGRGLELRVGGERLALRPLRHVLGFPPGAGGLRTLRLEVVFAAGPVARGDSPLRLAYRDRNFASRIGWKEVVLTAASGAAVAASSVPTESVSDELRAYPADLLRSPLDVTGLEASFVPGREAGPPPPLSSEEDVGSRVAVRETGAGGFAGLVDDDLSAGVILLSLLVAVFWGAAHAFSPGHGKAIVAAYLIGSRGTARHALYLGLIVTVTHTIGVFALGLVTLALSEFIVPEQLYPWLNLVSALLVVAVGVTVLRWRLGDWRKAYAHSEEHHHHGHEHGHHHHHHGRTHAPAPGSGMRGLVSMGISGGIIPCPTALVVLLAAISLHRVGYGLVLILAFSVGLAGAMTAIGLVAISAKQLARRIDFEAGFVRLLPAVSALVICGFGIAMTVRAIPQIT